MKYYQIRENEGDFKSIGVIQVSAENEYPLDKIQEAIESHLDEEITLLSVDLQERYGSLNIHFRKEDMTKEVFTAEETWLYFTSENLSNQTDQDLKAELSKRGFKTDAMWCNQDVLNALEEYNSENLTDHKLEESELSDILRTALESESYFETANDLIQMELKERIEEEENV